MSRVNRINSRRLIGVLVALALVTGAAGVAFAFRRHQIAEHFAMLRSQGMAADARHDAGTAVNLLGEYLARFPDDVPALICFSDDRLLVPLPGNAEIPIAIQSLRYTLHLDPALQRQHRLLMGLYLQTAYWSEALDSADSLLASETPAVAKTDQEALKARATALARLRRSAEATTAATMWCAADPASIDARLLRLDLAHVADATHLQNDVMIQEWADNGALSSAAIDLLKGHARLLSADRANARVALTAATHDEPFDTKAAGPLAHDLDQVGLFDLALQVTRDRHKAEPANQEVLVELVHREWIAQQFPAVIALADSAPDRAKLPPETIGLEAVARSELGHNDQLARIQTELAARTDVMSHAWLAVVAELAAEKFEPDALLAACGPALREADGPILRYYVGESYLKLGDHFRAEEEWQRVITSEPAWALPAIHLSELLTEDGRFKPAIAAGYEAVRRAPHDSNAVITLATAKARAVDAGQDSDINGTLDLINQLMAQLPDDPQLPSLQATVLARSYRPADAAAAIKRSLASDRVLPEQVWFNLAAASEVAQLGLEQQCLERDRKEHGITPQSAYARAVSMHFSARSSIAPPTQSASQPVLQDAGLVAFDNDRIAAGTAQSHDLAWSLTRVRYLDATSNSAAREAWATLSDDFADDARVQALVCSAELIQGDKAAMNKAVQRLKAAAGPQAVATQLATARFDLIFGTTPDEFAEARNLLNGVLQQTPDLLEARLLSARANEKSGRMVSAINDLRAALNIDPESVTVRLALARLLQSQGDFSGAVDQFDHLDLARLTTDDQRQQAASLLVQHGQPDRAINLLRGPASSLSPTGRLLLARLYQRTGKPDQALEVVEELLRTNPSAAAIAFGADLLASMGKMDDARQLLDRLSDLSAGEISRGIADLIRAEFILRYQPNATPGEPLALLASATTAEPKNAVIWRARISADIALNQVEDAATVAVIGTQSLPDDPVLVFFRDNAAWLESLRTDPAVRPLLQRALNDPEQLPAVSATVNVIHTAAIDEQPVEWIVNRLSDISRTYPASPAADLYLITVLQHTGRLDDAVSLAMRIGQAFPDDPTVLRAETEALTKAKRWVETIQLAGKWKQQANSDALSADLAAANAMIESGRGQDVADLLLPYTQHPQSAGYLPAMTTLARARVISGQTGPESVMEPLLSQGASGRAAWMLFAVDLLPADQASFAVNRAVMQMPAADPNEHVTASEMWMRLANRTGNMAYAKSAADVLAPYLGVSNPPVRVLLASASWSEKLGNVDQAESLYKQVLTVQPSQSEALNNLAMIMARSGRAEQALPLMDRAIGVAPQLADLYDTRAFVLLKIGKVDAAIADVNHALQLDARRIDFRVRKIQLLVAANRTTDADTALRRIESDYADANLMTPEIRRQLASAHAAVGH